jgi:hypothetical protein
MRNGCQDSTSREVGFAKTRAMSGVMHPPKGVITLLCKKQGVDYVSDSPAKPKNDTDYPAYATPIFGIL